LFALASRIIDFVLFTVVPAVAVLFYLLGGLMLLLSRGNTGLITTGKNFFWNTTWGLVIIFGAWMITNTVLKSLAGDSDVSNNWYKIECTTTVQQPSGLEARYACHADQCVADANGSYLVSNCNNECGKTINFVTNSLPDAVVGESYTQQIVVLGGAFPNTFSITDGSLPPGLSLSQFGTISGKPTTAGTYTFTVKVEDSSEPIQSATKQLSIRVATTAAGVQRYSCNSNGQCVADQNGQYTASNCDGKCQTAGGSQGVTCPFSGVNLCQGQSPPGGCSNSRCGQYAASINKYASGAATVNLLKSILFNESSCNISAATGSSFGLMQLQSSTANMYKARCGVTENITSSWLTNPANADKSVCIAAQYVNAIAQSICGSSPRNIYAGYNGGTGASGACGESVSCAGEKSCSNEAVRRWECLYDNSAHTICNTGYSETRSGVRKVIYCVNNPGF